MRGSRFKEEQIIGILREQESRTKRADVSLKHDISSATFYTPMDCSPVARVFGDALSWLIANIYPASPDDGAPKWGIRPSMDCSPVARVFSEVVDFRSPVKPMASKNDRLA